MEAKEKNFQHFWNTFCLHSKGFDIFVKEMRLIWNDFSTLCTVWKKSQKCLIKQKKELKRKEIKNGKVDFFTLLKEKRLFDRFFKRFSQQVPDSDKVRSKSFAFQVGNYTNFDKKEKN